MRIESSHENTRNSHFSGPRGTESGTLCGQNDLESLAAALRNLSPADRARLAAVLARQCDADAKEGGER
jgi:hypothetical protein